MFCDDLRVLIEKEPQAPLVGERVMADRVMVSRDEHKAEFAGIDTLNSAFEGCKFGSLRVNQQNVNTIERLLLNDIFEGHAWDLAGYSIALADKQSGWS